MLYRAAQLRTESGTRARLRIEKGGHVRVRVIIGGGVVTELVKRHTGADAFTDDAMEGVEIIKTWASR
jgi:methanogenic corrinoid protein MtbC1